MKLAIQWGVRKVNQEELQAPALFPMNIVQCKSGRAAARPQRSRVRSHLGGASIVLLCQLFVAACGRLDQVLPPVIPTQAGIALTFDDMTVEQWFSARPLFLRYGARATFFIDHFNLLSRESLEMLHTLQMDGHEIASHSWEHVNPVVYLSEDTNRTPSDYIQEQVVPSIEAMRKEGFDPLSFSYPGGCGTLETDLALLEYFKMVRTNYKQDVFYEFDGKRVLGARNIDHLFRREQMEYELQSTKSGNKVLILYGHKIGMEPGQYFVSMENLEYILKSVKELGMRFYRFSDLNGLGIPSSSS